MSFARVLLAAIRGYRFLLSPWVGRYCRFTPTCSCYAQQAIARFGALYGAWLTLKRLARCQPFAKGGYEPVPEIRGLTTQKTHAFSCEQSKQGEPTNAQKHV